MDIYKQAIREKLKFQTPKGIVNLEQLWDLPMTHLTTAIKNAAKAIKESSPDDDELSFLSGENKVSPEQKLTFDILKDVYVTRKEEKAKERKAAEDKEHNEKILALIHEKQEESTRSKSIEELTAMLR